MDKILYRETTGLQELLIFENRVFGRVLALDGVVQTTEGDERIYHEMLSHVPILAHGAARRVLIIGGGDGGMAREVMRHQSVTDVTMVEIDRTVIDLCRAHLPSLNRVAFDDPRLDLVITDGAGFVEKTEARWDIIIVDSTDPLGPGEVLFGERFYRGCKRCLMPGGILVTQNGVPYVQGAEITNSHRRLVPHFRDVWFYVAPVPTYQGGHMAFGWASDDASLRRISPDVIARRFETLSLSMSYYTPQIHVAAFALPAYVKALLA